jgi:hypothetical protein
MQPDGLDAVSVEVADERLVAGVADLPREAGLDGARVAARPTVRIGIYEGGAKTLRFLNLGW